MGSVELVLHSNKKGTRRLEAFRAREVQGQLPQVLEAADAFRQGAELVAVQMHLGQLRHPPKGPGEVCQPVVVQPQELRDRSTYHGV